jgi:hypothetical protein
VSVRSSFQRKRRVNRQSEFNDRLFNRT